MTATCETCRWWLLVNAKNIPDGRCYRYPKTRGQHHTHFCGEHQSKDKT